jgi:predicted transcriptional regulator
MKKNKHLDIRLSDEELERVKGIAERNGMSISELILQSVDEFEKRKPVEKGDLVKKDTLKDGRVVKGDNGDVKKKSFKKKDVEDKGVKDGFNKEEVEKEGSREKAP